jgi:hypothetical protein
VPTRDRIDWPYVTLLVAIVLVIAAALHLLSAWVAVLIFAVLWVGSRMCPKNPPMISSGEGGSMKPRRRRHESAPNHEAGHAVAAVALRLKIGMRGVTIATAQASMRALVLELVAQSGRSLSWAVIFA